ncbi:MAG TPA: primosomal protein N' [Deltaproteobacteria bacterium]|nr:primosomal protein N' [Deltaproteobacteria bacterium]
MRVGLRRRAFRARSIFSFIRRPFMKRPSDISQRFVSLWLPVPRRMAFSYALPESWPDLAPGRLVLAPLGRRHLPGLVAAVNVEPPPGIEIKSLSDLLPEELSLAPALLRVFDWARSHYLAPPGEVLRSFLPPKLLQGIFQKGEKARLPSSTLEATESEKHRLNDAQQNAVREILERPRSFQPYLLQGVTGSGKTEVYLQTGEAVLREGKAALILVPEIALTPQTVSRFAARFGEQVAAYHSSMTETQRLKVWWECKQGLRRVVVGTRSAVCLPFPNLGLIVVDEEHDSSYKQEERFRYHGRDLAVVRAKEENIPILLGSATPSLESLENVARGKYRLLKLPQRATAGRLPELELVDLKKNPADPETLLTAPLAADLEAVHARGEQSLLFLNRRGFAPFLLCRACGEALDCPNCEISLTYHKRPSALLCHYCEYRSAPPALCPACASEELMAVGSGTERLEEALQARWPGWRIARLDRDVTQSRLRTEEILTRFAAGEIDVLVGTQLIAKGHDFKRLTLVGVLLADSALHQPDFRAAERLFQLVTQVAGRAGRHDLPGKVWVQTFRPGHYAIDAALTQDPERFFLQESEFRRESGYPPFQRLILLRLSGAQAVRVEGASADLAEQLGRLFRLHPGIKILGPAKPALEKLRGKYRRQVLLRSVKFEAMRRILEEKLNYFEKSLPTGVQLHVDVDPVGVM